MRKPDGQFKCMACGRLQPGSLVEWSDRRGRWICEDVFCGGNVFPVDDRKRHYLNIHIELSITTMTQLNTLMELLTYKEED